MGIVLKQSVRNVIVTCLGFALGAVNTLFLFTHFISKEYYGLVTYLMSTSNLLWPLLAFGAHNTLVKFFSSYTSGKEQQRFLSLMIFFPVVIGLIMGMLGVFFYDYLIEYFENGNVIVKPYIWTIYVLAIALAYFEIFFAWSKVKLKSVFGNLLRELFLRVWICVGLLMIYFKIITVEAFIYSLVMAYIIRMGIMLIYALKLHPLKIQFSLPDNYMDVLKYSFLILIAGSVATLLIDLDKTMLEHYFPIESVAKYGICAYIASVIIIPSRAMHQITYPLTAQYLNYKNLDALGKLYKQSSLNLLIISGLLFVLILCNVETLFLLIPDQYQLYIGVVLLIGLSKLFDNAIGNNNAILFSSDYYRLVLAIGIVMAILSFVLNITLIPFLELTGAALATFGAVFCYNLMKLYSVWIKFKIHPFTKKTIFSITLIILFILVYYFWNFNIHPALAIVLKSSLIAVTYLMSILIFNLSEDINSIVKKVLKGKR